ncbi:MAG: pyridoxamine kinase [Dysgonomonas sp.]|nr:pyridoxamine kinase [Dysgonomonas sp.]
MFSNKTKRIVAIHDLSGIGRVSLSVVIPILTAMGFQVSPLPTAILSNHTQYPDFSFLDLTDEMKKIIGKWKSMDAEFDTFYSGYLGSPEQVQIVKEFVQDFRKEESLVVVDPVLGDNGRLYTGFDNRIAEEMRLLISMANVITPNLTEVSYLLDIPYEDRHSIEKLKDYLLKLSEKGPQIVIITNVPVLNDPHQTSVYAYNRKGNRFWKVTCPYLPAHYPGVGDTFTSVITGALMQGDSLPMALDRATQFCYQGIRATFGYEYDTKEGILLEKVLPYLNIPIQVSSYEII